jgi:hypothetical protein
VTVAAAECLEHGGRVPAGGGFLPFELEELVIGAVHGGQSAQTLGLLLDPLVELCGLEWWKTCLRTLVLDDVTSFVKWSRTLQSPILLKLDALMELRMVDYRSPQVVALDLSQGLSDSVWETDLKLNAPNLRTLQIIGLVVDIKATEPESKERTFVLPPLVTKLISSPSLHRLWLTFKLNLKAVPLRYVGQGPRSVMVDMGTRVKKLVPDLLKALVASAATGLEVLNVALYTSRAHDVPLLGEPAGTFDAAALPFEPEVNAAVKTLKSANVWPGAPPVV